jgi:hypothetical protein
VRGTRRKRFVEQGGSHQSVQHEESGGWLGARKICVYVCTGCWWLLCHSFLLDSDSEQAAANPVMCKFCRCLCCVVEVIVINACVDYACEYVCVCGICTDVVRDLFPVLLALYFKCTLLGSYKSRD